MGGTSRGGDLAPEPPFVTRLLYESVEARKTIGAAPPPKDLMIHVPWNTERLLAKMADTELPYHPVAHRPRSQGIHLSDLYHRLHPQKANTISEDGMTAYRVGGLALEDRMERALIELAKEDGTFVERPREMVSPEGIICSPDLFFVTDSHLRIGETKVAWKSCYGLVVDREGENEFPAKFDIYWTQVSGYGYVAGTTEGRIIVYFVNGDYRARTPQLLGWDLSFSHQEQAETWDQLMGCYYEICEERAEAGNQ